MANQLVRQLELALSKTVVVGSLATVEATILKDANIRKKVERDLGYITWEVQMMQAILNDANGIIFKNHPVMTWVRNVRELAYDLEDYVEFVVHLGSKQIYWRRVIPKAFVASISWLPLDEAVAELGELKSRAEALSKCYLRYSNIADSTGSKLIMLQQPASSAAIGTTGLNMLVEAREAATRRKGFVDLAKLIAKNGGAGHRLQAASVWGAAGDLGKTSIISKVYHDPEIRKNFSCRAWVKLVHPFNPHEFIRRFMAQVYQEKTEEHAPNSQEQLFVVRRFLNAMGNTGEDLLKEFMTEVRIKRYFVVLEDLTDILDWDAIRAFLPDMNNGSWIVVSTQQFEIASLCVGRSYQVIELEKFSADQSIYAFINGNLDVMRTDNDTISNVEQKWLTLLTFLGCQDDETNMKEAASDWMRIFHLTGRESEMNELRRCTSMGRSSNFTVLSVWGIPGIGKSALIRNLFCATMLHRDKSGDQFDNYCWVDISHPFDLSNFCSRLLMTSGSQTNTITNCRKVLKKERCLVVIDNLGSKEEWDLICTELISKTPEGVITSKGVFIVITTEASIARHCCADKDELVFNVKCMEHDAALELFSDEVQRNNPSSLLYPSTSVELKELIIKCGGIPRVIVKMASFLATNTLTWMDAVSFVNGRFIHQLESDPGFYSLRGLFGWMHSILYTLPDFLKPFILYLSVFPRDSIFRRRRLVRRWIAEGFSRDNDGKSAEEQGEKNFSELVELSIIQQSQKLASSTFNDTRMVLCQVLSFLHEYIISRRIEENLVFELGDSCALTTQGIGRHLVILNSWVRNRVLFERINLSRLRSLTVFGKWESFFISERMKVLRVLDLENSWNVTDEDLKKVMKLLHLLKFLSLRGQMKINHLPRSLGRLKHLETLDVRGTSIATLPASTSKLQKLQYIRAGATFHQAPEGHTLPLGVKAPKRIGRMTALHTLGIINVADSGMKEFVEDLRDLTQLRKLGVSGIKKENAVEVFSAINGYVHLESLSVQLSTDNADCLDALNVNGPPLLSQNLRSLKLYGLHRLPDWGNRPSRLSKVHLEMDTLPRSTDEFLDQLPQLCIFRIKLLKDGELRFNFSYEKVKFLEIDGSDSYSELHVWFGQGTMKKLELLRLDCSRLSYHLHGLNYLSGLKQILLKGTNDEEIKTSFENQLLNHPNKPAVKLEGLARSS